MHIANNFCNNQYIRNRNSHVINALECNRYYKNAIDNISRKINQLSHDPHITDFEYVSAPYIRGTSERVAWILRKLWYKTGIKPDTYYKTWVNSPKRQTYQITYFTSTDDFTKNQLYIRFIDVTLYRVLKKNGRETKPL